MALDPNLVPVTFARGVDNRSQETKLKPGFARRMENVNIDTDGTVSMRAGYSLTAALPNAHSLWGHDTLPFALVADSTSLYMFEVDGALTTLVTGLSGADISYAAIGNKAYWSNGVQQGVVTAQGKVAPWGVETPIPSFGYEAVSNGGLYAGTYSVAITYANAAREEGASTDPVFVNVPDGGGIQLTNLPTPQHSGPTEIRVYVTSANGTDLQYASSAAIGASQFLIGAHSPGRMLNTLFDAPFPPAKMLLAKMGRLFGAIGKKLVWSRSLYYGLYNPTGDYFGVPSDITMLAAPDSTQFLIYIGTANKVYAFQGDSVDMASISIVSNHGAIPGSMTMMPSEVFELDAVSVPTPVWVGTDGVPYAGAVGGIITLHKNFVYPIADKAAAIFVPGDGANRYIVNSYGSRPSGLAATDTVVARVYDNGGGP